MVVNSLDFLLFFIVVFVVYYAPGIQQYSTRQNVWLLLTSYIFYGFVDWKMLPLLLGVTVLFYWLGSLIYKAVVDGNKKRAKLILRIGASIGIGILLYFKYLNFFADSFATMLRHIGLSASWSTLNIVLPIGVSFFTFKLISYLIEIKRNKIQPAKNFLEFATYIAFFPTILSGPIDRPNTFLTQLRHPHSLVYDKAVDGCQQIIWGIFTKMVIADNLASVTSWAWNEYSTQNASFLLWAILLSPLQVYADFEGYSNMAIGVGKILGFDIAKNFDHPLLARNVSEYWNRWHISLTGWITDYVFTPISLALRDWSNFGIMLAIAANLVLIGLWHGANWTYAVFGLYHSLLFIPLIVTGSFGKNKKVKENKYGLPYFKDIMMMLLTYIIIGIGHVIFFAKDVSSVFEVFKRLFTGKWVIQVPIGEYMLAFIIILFILEWTTRKKEYALQIHNRFHGRNRWKLYAIDWMVIVIIIFLGKFDSSQFIYFHF